MSAYDDIADRPWPRQKKGVKSGRGTRQLMPPKHNIAFRVNDEQLAELKKEASELQIPLAGVVLRRCFNLT